MYDSAMCKVIKSEWVQTRLNYALYGMGRLKEISGQTNLDPDSKGPKRKRMRIHVSAICAQKASILAVLRIHDILGWIRIRIRGSMPLTNGSGFGSGSWILDPDPGSWIRILDPNLLYSSLTFKMPARFWFFNAIFSAYDFLKLHLHHFSKIQNQKESQNNRNQGFFLLFCMNIEGSGSGSRAGSGSGSIPLTSGSGSGSWRPKNMWIRWIRIRIRIRIRNTGF
jgi:hypothetical protein